MDGWTGKARNINPERPKLVSSINSDMHVLADYLKCKIIIIIQRERERQTERETDKERQTNRQELMMTGTKMNKDKNKKKIQKIKKKRGE